MNALRRSQVAVSPEGLGIKNKKKKKKCKAKEKVQKIRQFLSINDLESI